MKPTACRLRMDTNGSEVCHRCLGDGKAHGSDRPFQWYGDYTYPGPCPVCKGSGVEPAK